MAVVTFAPQDAYAVMNSLVHQATGQTSITATDTSSFIDAGKTVLDTGVENVLNSLSVLIGRTIIASRPYLGKFRLIARNEADIFDNRVRKISFYARNNQPSGMFNTDLNTNLGAGLSDTDGTGSMWEQNPAIPVERFFYSSFTWDKSHTEYPEQIKLAFTSEALFIEFVNGVMTEVQNDIESTLEARNRMVVIDRIAGQKLLTDNGDLGAESAVNLTKAFNEEFGTAYSTAEILQEHLTAFLEFYVARVKIDSDFMENRSTLYHDPMTKTIDGVDYVVLRHTPKDRQRFIYYAPFFTKAKARVLPEIFNPQYLGDINANGEGIDYWQSITNPSAIDVTPALPNGAESSEVKLDLVIGMLFDVDAIMTNNKFTGMYTTPINARHVYTNMWWHYLYGVCQDYSENCILYYMADESETFTGDGVEDDFVLTGDVTEILSVTVDGVATSEYTYDSDTKTITFTTAPADEAVIVVTYK